MIEKSISAEKLFEVVVIAYEYDRGELKGAVYKFLSANRDKRYFTNLTHTREWFIFAVEKFDLVKKILDNISVKMGTDY